MAEEIKTLMKTISEIRRENLLFLIERYGSLVKLNVYLGRKKNDATLSQIKNRAPSSKTGKARVMGDLLARNIEFILTLPAGWMDKEHPQQQALPENNGEKNKRILFSKYNQFSKIPLYELKQRLQDGKFIQTLNGEIEVPGIFIDKAAYRLQGKNLEAYYITDVEMGEFVPFGSIIIIDRDINNYVKDGIYLVELNNSLFYRRIITSIKGGYMVFSSSTEKEHIEDLSTLKILGFAVLCWVQKTL